MKFLTDEEFKEMVKVAKSLNSLVKEMGRTRYLNFEVIQRRIINLNLDVSHWSNTKWYHKKGIGIGGI